MLSYTNIPILALLSFLSLYIGLGSGLDSNSTGIYLWPINVVDFEAAVGIRRRSEESLAGLDLETQSQLIYGVSGGNPVLSS